MTKPHSHFRRRLIPALLAGGACTLAGQPVQAVQLGELQVQSGLGQPLRASIAYALSANEQLHDYCIFINSGTTSGIPALTRAQLSLSAGRINISSNAPIREPMVTIGLTVNCPYSANLTRSYTLLLDPVPKFQPAPQTATSTPATVSTQTGSPPVSRPATNSRPQIAPEPRRTQTPISATGSYRVAVGDTLSDIAARIEDRPVGLWQAVNTIFEANPDAFVNGDLNRLKAGSVLVLPSFGGETVTTVGRADVPSTFTPTDSERSAAQEQATVATEAPAPTIAPAVEPVAETTATASDETNVATSIPFPTASGADTAAQTGTDLAAATSNAPASETDTAIDSEQPVTAVELPQTTTFVATDDGSSPLLYWLGGAGLALFLGLVAFRSRSRFVAPVTPTPSIDVSSESRISDTPDEPVAKTDIDFDIGVEAGTQSSVALDADLSAGTGLNDGTDVEVAQDFGFSTSMHTATDDNAELASGATITGQRPAADAMPGHRFVEESILEREILPTDDEYDLSMVVDATKQPFSEEDVTAKDLVTIASASESTDAEDDSAEYTLNEPVDLETLEQDYEDELTATQALNAEIEEAAANLAENIAAFDEADTAKIVAIDANSSATGSRKRIVVEDDDDETAIMTDLDDTGVNEALLPNHDDLTAEIPHRRETDKQAIDWSFEGTAEMPATSDESRDRLAETSANTQLTEELPTAENDPTLEMDVESGHFRTKKLRG